MRFTGYALILPSTRKETTIPWASIVQARPIGAMKRLVKSGGRIASRRYGAEPKFSPADAIMLAKRRQRHIVNCYHSKGSSRRPDGKTGKPP